MRGLDGMSARSDGPRADEGLLYDSGGAVPTPLLRADSSRRLESRPFELNRPKDRASGAVGAATGSGEDVETAGSSRPAHMWWMKSISVVFLVTLVHLAIAAIKCQLRAAVGNDCVDSNTDSNEMS